MASNLGRILLSQIGGLADSLDRFLNMLVSWLRFIFNSSREPGSPEIIENGLLAYFRMVRSILLQGGHFSRRDYIPEIRFFNKLGDEMISGRGLDGTVLHDVLCRLNFSTR